MEFAVKASPKYRNLLEKVESLAREKEDKVEDELDKEILRLESKALSKYQINQQTRAREDDELKRRADIIRGRMMRGLGAGSLSEN